MDTGGSDDIPVVERYRGCGLHDCQSTERLLVVRTAIDHVYTLEQVLDLVDYAGNVRNPPESRLLAVARCRALWELAQEAREPRPIIQFGARGGVGRWLWVAGVAEPDAFLQLARRPRRERGSARPAAGRPGVRPCPVRSTMRNC
jgi:hypothetical protein